LRREEAGAREQLAGHAGRRGWWNRCVQQAGDVAGEQVDLEVDRVADGALAEGGDGEGVRDEADGEAGVVDVVDREADAVDAGTSP
jgi:hypothetical protein